MLQLILKMWRGKDEHRRATAHKLTKVLEQAEDVTGAQVMDASGDISLWLKDGRVYRLSLLDY